MVFFTFILFVVGVSCIIGLVASKKSRKSDNDYFLASQSISPYSLAFSSVASKFSGFVFSGFMGFAYLNGTAAAWLSLGMLIGAFMVYAFAVFRLQEMNSGGWALSIGELITFWRGENRIWLRRFIGFLTLLFLSVYAAVQLKVGGQALNVAFDQPVSVGILLSTTIILFYCWSGGIRASIWTDTAQIIMMTLGLALILITATLQAGGVTELFNSFMTTGQDNPDQVSLIPKNLSVGGYPGFILFFLGAITLGIATIGQPHVLIRNIALQNPSDAKKFIISIFCFETLFKITFVLVGLCTRVILEESDFFDPELALFLSAEKLLWPVGVGFVLASVFSSTLSTADSQILSCSASLMRDLPEPPKESLWLAKTGTVTIAIIATIIALFAEDSVFALVEFAFSGLGASIGSVLILRLLNVNISEWGAILVSLAGGGTVIAWKLLGLKPYVNESLPGFLAALLTFLLVKAFYGLFLKNK